MKQLNDLPTPPNPANYPTPLAWQRAMFDWATVTRGKIAAASMFNDSPLDQAFSLGSYTLTTSLAGTATGTQVTNFLLTVLDAMKRRGIIKRV